MQKRSVLPSCSNCQSQSSFFFLLNPLPPPLPSSHLFYISLPLHPYLTSDITYSFLAPIPLTPLLHYPNPRISPTIFSLPPLILFPKPFSFFSVLYLQIPVHYLPTNSPHFYPLAPSIFYSVFLLPYSSPIYNALPSFHFFPFLFLSTVLLIPRFSPSRFSSAALFVPSHSLLLGLPLPLSVCAFFQRQGTWTHKATVGSKIAPTLKRTLACTQTHTFPVWLLAAYYGRELKYQRRKWSEFPSSLSCLAGNKQSLVFDC